MASSSPKNNRRRQSRMQAVLPVRVRGTDASGQPFEALAHTLDLTTSGTRLGALRQEVQAPATLSVFYRQRKRDFTVVWSKRLEGSREFQIGLQAIAPEKEPWGLNLCNSSSDAQGETRSATSGAF